MANTRIGLAATHHYVDKIMANVSFPACKKDIIAAVGSESVPVSAEKHLSMAEILEDMGPSSYSCAAEFFCALSACLLKAENEDR